MARAAARKMFKWLAPQPLQEKMASTRQRARHIQARRDPEFQKSIDRLALLKDVCSGERCVVIGNGPSMAGFDLSKLAGIKTFCLNRGYLLWNEQGLTPDYLVAVDQLIIEQFAREWQSVQALKFAPWLKRAHFTKDDHLIFFEERWDKVFIQDARNGLASLATVTNTTLQLAWHMGFSTVILLGIDHHFKASEAGQPNEMFLQKVGDVDHFHPRYFAPGTRWHLPDLKLSEKGYKLARDAFDAAGRRIVNATPGTRLQVFETAPLADLLIESRS